MDFFKDLYRVIGIWGSLASVFSLFISFFLGQYRFYKKSIKMRFDFSQDKNYTFTSFLSLFNIVKQGDK